MKVNKIMEKVLKEAFVCNDSADPISRGIFIGNPASDMALDRKTYRKILRNQLTLIGTWNSSFTHEKSDDWNYCSERLAQGKIKPEKLISH